MIISDLSNAINKYFYKGSFRGHFNFPVSFLYLSPVNILLSVVWKRLWLRCIAWIIGYEEWKTKFTHVTMRIDIKHCEKIFEEDENLMIQNP